MSGHTVEEIRSEMRRYWVVGTALFLLTVITVAVSYLDVSQGVAIAIALVIACLKGGLVAAVFMHLISEKQAIYSLLLLTVLFFIVLMLGPMGGRLGSTALG
ncbi:MAG: cytochrome C oxidase subunit IV family protein [Acidobacteriota bacterium]|nr:cytochrome C oxidase subunit IV family protein [Acidobacteriota bacterium]